MLRATITCLMAYSLGLIMYLLGGNAGEVAITVILILILGVFV